MMKFVSFLLLTLSFRVSADIDFRGHHRLIGSTFSGSMESYENSSYFSQVVLNNRIIGLYTDKKHTFEMAYELFTSYNHYEVPFLQSDLENQRFNYRVTDFDYYLIQHKLLDPDSYSVIHNLDRFFYQYSNDNFDIKIGRQPISFGSARTVNPLDVLVPFDLVMINMEQKNGVDALKGRYAFSEMGVLEIGSVLEKETHGKDQFRFVSIADTFLKEAVDLKLLYATLKQHIIRGLDIQASLGGWGTWLEYGLFSTIEDQEFKRYTVGGQYMFPNDMNLFLEYHYNESGTEKSKEYLQTKNQSFIKDFGVYLYGKEYLNFGGGYSLTPLKSISLSIMSNFNDGSKLFSPSFDYNFKEDWLLQVGGFYGTGVNELKGTSEFAYYPKAFFLNLKNFF